MNPDNKLKKESEKSFEQLVLEKIHKKKNMKRVFLYTVSIFLFLVTSIYFITRHISYLSYKNKNFQAKYEINEKKESILLTDKFYLPTSNLNSHYLIQEISYQDTDDQI